MEYTEFFYEFKMLAYFKFNKSAFNLHKCFFQKIEFTGLVSRNAKPTKQYIY